MIYVSDFLIRTQWLSFLTHACRPLMSLKIGLVSFHVSFFFSLSVFTQYFYNAQTQEYLYWDATSKAYIPVPGGTSIEIHPATMTAEDQAILSNPAADAPLELKKPSAPPQATESPTPVLGAGGASETISTPTAASEKKDEDDPSKKDKEEKPKSLAAVKVRHWLS